MAKVSEAIIERVFDVLLEAEYELRADEVAATLGLHKTTARDALDELLKREVAQRVVGKSTHGHPPYLYSRLDGESVLATPAEAETSGSDNHKTRPKTVRRARRGDMPNLIREVLQTYNPNGRGFTIYQLHKRIKQGSYETVRKGVAELVETGEIIETDRCRKHSRVYLPAPRAVAEVEPEPEPTTNVVSLPAPVQTSEPTNPLSEVEALIKERDETLKRHAADEVRLAEIELALDAVRALLA
jgi:predicted DNA-binding transcriptional regulator